MKYIFKYCSTDGCTYECDIIIPFECDDIDKLIYDSICKLCRVDVIKKCGRSKEEK